MERLNLNDLKGNTVYYLIDDDLEVKKVTAYKVEDISYSYENPRYAVSFNEKTLHEYYIAGSLNSVLFSEKDEAYKELKKMLKSKILSLNKEKEDKIQEIDISVSILNTRLKKLKGE